MPEPIKTPPKITLEGLLRLKRHERPAPEFWLRFDRELNARVWRTLVQPEASAGFWSGIFSRQARWLAVGFVSTAAVVLAVWPGQPVRPNASSVPAQTALANPGVQAPEGGPEKEPMRVAMVLPVLSEENVPSAEAQPRYAVAAIDNSPSAANYNKVPATAGFGAEASNGMHYAADTLQSVPSSSRWGGAAY